MRVKVDVQQSQQQRLRILGRKAVKVATLLIKFGKEDNEQWLVALALAARQGMSSNES